LNHNIVRVGTPAERQALPLPPLADSGWPGPGSPRTGVRLRVESPELDRLRSHSAALASFRQAVIDLVAGRPDTDLMTVRELRAAVAAPPTAGGPLPVTWSGSVANPPGDSPRERTLVPLTTSHGTPACLALGDEERARLAGLLAATLHPAEACTTPRCGESERQPDPDPYVDDGARLGWIAVRVCGAPGPLRWWCSPACAGSAITAAGADMAAADRAAATDPGQQGRTTGAGDVAAPRVPVPDTLSEFRAAAVRALAEYRGVSR
jgi:hypothetical protein